MTYTIAYGNHVSDLHDFQTDDRELAAFFLLVLRDENFAYTGVVVSSPRGQQIATDFGNGSFWEPFPRD